MCSMGLDVTWRPQLPGAMVIWLVQLGYPEAAAAAVEIHTVATAAAAAAAIEH